MKHALLVAAAVGLAVAPAAHARLRSAAWSTDPAAPVYVGQAYDLTLTLETDADEEVPTFTIDQVPAPVRDSGARNPDAQEHTVRDGVRRTVFRWHVAEDSPRLVAIPLTRVVADVMTVRQFGFMRSAQTTRQGVGAPAFSYEAVPLPGEAAGAPIGTFGLTLGADAPDFAPGDVRTLTATLVAKEGRVPAEVAFALAPAEGVRAWPWRVTERTDKRLVAKACVAIDAEGPVTLRLEPLKVFDLGARALREVAAAPLSLALRAPEAKAPAARGPEPLRFAPAATAPTVGALGAGAEPTGDVAGEWARVRMGDRTGWVRRAALEGGTP